MYYNSITFLIFQLCKLNIIHKKTAGGRTNRSARPDQGKGKIFSLLNFFHTDPCMFEDDFTYCTTPLYDLVQHFLFLSVKVANLF